MDVIFSTSKKLKAICGNFTLLYNVVEINETDCYQYLGSTIDPNLIMNENFGIAYKKHRLDFG